MKVRNINWMMLMIAMFITPACSNKDDFTVNDGSGFPEILEEFKDNSAIVKSLANVIEKKTELSYQTWWNEYQSNYECFHSSDDLKKSPYASIIDELPDVDWQQQTLVVACIYHNYIFFEHGCNVYGKSGKYTIEYKLGPGIGAAFDVKGIAVILNQPNVWKKDVNFKVCIAGHDYE